MPVIAGEEHTMPYLTKNDPDAARVRTTGQKPHPAPCAAGYPTVRGACPACGNESLFLGQGGYVTCAILRCPAPAAATDLLARGRDGEAPDEDDR